MGSAGMQGQPLPKKNLAGIWLRKAAPVYELYSLPELTLQTQLSLCLAKLLTGFWSEWTDPPHVGVGNCTTLQESNFDADNYVIPEKLHCD